MKFDIEQYLRDLQDKNRGLFVLLDPDSASPGELAQSANKATKAGVDAFLIGGSFLLKDDFSKAIREVKTATDLPVFIFPGNGYQVSAEADGIFFLTLISGRNARWLIEEQVQAAPRVIDLGIPTLPTGYMLVESGGITSVQFISGTMPIPREKNDIAVAHALAGKLLGMKALYVEAGSGAEKTAPSDMISAIKTACDLPLFVGGGIKSVETASELRSSGADFLVIGTAFERENNIDFLQKISENF